MAQLINTFVRTVDLDVVDTDLSYKRVYFVYKNDCDAFCHGMTNHKGASNDIHTLLQDLDDGCCTIHFDLALALAAALRALISPKARLYSLGNTLTNFKRACAQLSNNSRARWLPVHLWWSSSNLRN